MFNSTLSKIKIMAKKTNFKVGDKVIYHGHEMVITSIYGERADLEYPNALFMTVNVIAIKLSNLKKL